MLVSNPVVINFSGDWVSAITNILLLLVTSISVYYAFKAYNHQKERSKKDAACKLAAHYAKSIIKKCTNISTVLDEAGINNEIKEIFAIRDLEMFDRDELDRLLSDKSISLIDLAKKYLDIDPKLLLNAKISKASSVVERELVHRVFTSKDKDGTEKVINTKLLHDDFVQDIMELLNELEWFAMNCNYNLADEEILYQSLHQTYLSTVWMLYFFISSTNETNEDKTYTNLIWLFVEWRNRLVNITDSTEAEKQEYIRKANAVKASVYQGTRLK
mgnify:CR=1 FL=1